MFVETMKEENSYSYGRRTKGVGFGAYSKEQLSCHR